MVFSPLTDRMGGARWTLVSGIGLVASIAWTMTALVPDTSSAEALRGDFSTFLWGMLAIFLFSGIGNAYSDEILHRARLSPLTLSTRLDEAETARLYEAARATLLDWISRLRARAGGGRVRPRRSCRRRRGRASPG